MKFVLFLLLFLVNFVQAAERVKWERGKEIIVELKLSEERKLVFPEKVRFAAKRKYLKMFNHSLLDNSFYLTPISEFSLEKLTLQGLDTGRFYILDTSVSNTAAKSSDDLIIHYENKKAPVANSNNKALLNSGVKVSPIDLVQYAAQHFYAPDKKLIEAKAGIKRIAINTRLIPNLYRGGEFEAVVLAGWLGGGSYVTAVKLTNKTKSIVRFNPCNIRGDFYSSTAQFNLAFPAGTNKDFTVVYIISEKPFDVAIKSRRLLCV